MSRLIDLTGQRFNRLIVIKRDMLKVGNIAYWICKCDCGNIISVRGDRLRGGNTQSCGCLRKEKIFNSHFIDLTGQKFGYLTVLKRDTLKTGRPYWICKCDCGNIVSVRGSYLKNGDIVSCGCYKKFKGEEKIEKILSSLDIKFVQQKTFEDLKYKDKLRFDFFLPKYNICIEYQGKQHYEAIEYFGGEKTFKEIQIRDDIKREWCKKNNIKLIEISYQDYDKIDKDYLKSRL